MPIPANFDGGAKSFTIPADAGNTRKAIGVLRLGLQTFYALATNEEAAASKITPGNPPPRGSIWEVLVVRDPLKSR